MTNRKFKVTAWCRSYSTCIVEAKDEDEATELALSSDCWNWSHEGCGDEIDSVEEIVEMVRLVRKDK
jgi:hypothetical protein